MKKIELFLRRGLILAISSIFGTIILLSIVYLTNVFVEYLYRHPAYGFLFVMMAFLLLIRIILESIED